MSPSHIGLDVNLVKRLRIDETKVFELGSPAVTSVRRPLYNNLHRMATIPKVLHEHINSAFPANVCLVATVLPNGFAQVTPRGSTMVFDDGHLALWERGKGTTNAYLKDGTKITVFFRKPQLRETGVLPKGGIARFYGTAAIHKSGAVYEKIWERLIQPEKDRDPEKKGFGVLITIERAEDLDGAPLV